MGASDYILVADWKRKWLAMVWREIQQEWFGKSGVGYVCKCTPYCMYGFIAIFIVLKVVARTL